MIRNFKKPAQRSDHPGDYPGAGHKCAQRTAQVGQDHNQQNPADGIKPESLESGQSLRQIFQISHNRLS